MDNPTPFDTLEQGLALHPKPWGTERDNNGEKEVALTRNGYMAMGLVLLAHQDCLDETAARACVEFARADNARTFHSILAAGARRFIETHDGDDNEPSCCVPGMTVGGLRVLMALYEIECQTRAAGGQA